MSEIFVNQALRLEFTIKDQDGAVVDISSATTKDIIVKTPDKSASVVVKAASLVNDGTDGKMDYNFVSNVDITISGQWRTQSLVIIAGKEYPATIINFTVSERLS